MKKHIILFILLFSITIGFAALSTVLDIKGNVNIAENLEDFRIELTNLKINETDQTALMSNNKQSFTFIGSGNDTLEYTITNYSYQYDANISLNCIPNENVTVEQVGELKAQSRLKKNITTTSTNQITCTIDVEKISRTDYAKDICPYEIEYTWAFNYKGAGQEFTVPCDGNYKFELWGASGGNISTFSGGKGAYTNGQIELSYLDNLYIYVGGAGSNTINGGYNGGTSLTTYQPAYGSSGGGATDVRLINGSWDNFDSLKSRIMVAAGGGGANHRNVDGSNYSSYYGDGNGGAGGALVGIDGETINYTSSYGTYNQHCYGTGGSQISGGIFYCLDSNNINTFLINTGIFGKTNYDVINQIQSGAGSGYYAGGTGQHGGGGGGSSFISGHSGCNAIAESSTSSNIVHTGQPNHYLGYVFTNTTMIAGNVSMPTHDGKSTMIGNSGNGYAKITYLGD